jgi:LmbE family N-acetylglucosaminyl deacetylase
LSEGTPTTERRRDRRVPHSLAVVAAHPDDETFGFGGAVRHYADQGVAAHLYCATDGDAGRASGVAVASPQELGLVRRQELQEAARILGFQRVCPGGHPDGRLHQLDQDALVGEVVDFLREHRPDVVLTLGPEGAPNGHRDHRVICRAATAAFFLAGLATAFPEQLAAGRQPHAPRRLFYATWPPPAPDDPRGLLGLPATARIDIRPYHDAKRRAFAAHLTQRGSQAPFEREGIRPAESYALASGVPQPAPLIEDLFAGL